MFRCRQDIKNCARVVVKLGSNIIATMGRGINKDLLKALVNEMSVLSGNGIELIIVSSGSIACGIETLSSNSVRTRLTSKEIDKKSIPMRQALASVGQSRLMHLYGELFGEKGIQVGQVLLTHEDMVSRKRFLNAKNTLTKLLEYGIIPIINENDTVSVDELKLGDNDNLAGQVVNLVSADLLILLSDVDGLYSGDPRVDSNASHFDQVDVVTRDIEKLAGDISNGFGTGGMYSKIHTVKRVSALGTAAVIASGKRESVISKVIAGEKVGTFFPSGRERITSRKHWIGFSLKEKGHLVLDNGARKALLKKGSSLLPSGIKSVEGKFDIGDPVLCIDVNGIELARGIVNYSSEEINRIKGCRSVEIETVLGYKYYDEVIHRDNMLIFV